MSAFSTRQFHVGSLVLQSIIYIITTCVVFVATSHGPNGLHSKGPATPVLALYVPTIDDP